MEGVPQEAGEEPVIRLRSDRIPMQANGQSDLVGSKNLHNPFCL